MNVNVKVNRVDTFDVHGAISLHHSRRDGIDTGVVQTSNLSPAVWVMFAGCLFIVGSEGVKGKLWE